MSTLVREIIEPTATDTDITATQPFLRLSPERDAETEFPAQPGGVAQEPEPAVTSETTASAPAAPDALPKPTSNRLISLDAFRGLTILGMLLVNNVALDNRTPKQMLHADWSGAVHLADLVFPWFLLIVGVAIPYAAASRHEHGESYWRFVPKVFGRAITLVLLGCLIDSSASHRPVFDLNVLQLIGLAYFVGALIYQLPMALRGLLAAVLLGTHWYILKFMPQPGAATGTFTEAQNAVIYLNQTYLNRFHLSGLVSVIPAAAMVLIGTGLGDLLRRGSLRPWRKFFALCGAGAAMVVLGWLWSRAIPFNKPCWSPSFILYTAGWAALTLAAFYAVLDVQKWRWGALPFLVFGSNAIFAYVAPILVKFYILQGWAWPGPNGKPWPLQTALLHASVVHLGHVRGGIAYTLAYVLVWWTVLFVLYRRKIFLRV